MPRPILYWTYEITSLDRHGDLQRDRQPWYDTQAEAQHDSDAHMTELEALQHTDVGVVIYPVYGAEVAV